MAFSAFERQDLVTKISDILAKAIVEGRLKPGARLNEVRLAREFDVSRAPLREALRRLESQGLLEALPRRGFFLREVTANGIAELLEIRLALESRAGAKVARAITDDQIEQIEAQLETYCAAASNNDATGLAEENLVFHRLICSLSGNERLLQIFDQIAREIRFGLAHLPELQKDPASVAQSHQPLIEALRSRDPVRWTSAITDHYEIAREMIVPALARREGEA